jgi:repressor LexA
VLTERQQEVLDYIKACISEGAPPTIREIQDEFNWKSPRAASQHVEALRRKGVIYTKYGMSRGIRMSTSQDCTEV